MWLLSWELSLNILIWWTCYFSSFFSVARLNFSSGYQSGSPFLWQLVLLICWDFFWETLFFGSGGGFLMVLWLLVFICSLVSCKANTILSLG